MASAVIERDLLFAEAQHRMANALQLVSAMIVRAARSVADPEGVDALRRADAQIQAFGLLNAMLGSDAVGACGGRLCAAAYLKRLCAHLDVACLTDRAIGLSILASEPQLASEAVCRHLGLIATELVMNAAKHAFVGRDGGELRVLLGCGGDGAPLHLVVADDGVGMEPDGLGAGQGLGFVEMLARGVGGAIEAQTGDKGSVFTVTISDPTVLRTAG